MPTSILMGDTINIKQDYKEKLYLSIVPTTISSHWEKVSDVANFVAEFYNHDFQDRSIQNNISTIINELVENAVKFSHVQNQNIDIYAFSDGDELVFQVTNSISEKSWDILEKIHHEMETTDLKTLYLERINNLAMDKSGTGIGLILLKKDYRVDINFSLDEKEKNDYLLTTTAKMKVA